MKSAIEWARGEVGVREPEAFRRYSDGEHVNWCAAFVIWCHRRARTQLPGNRWRARAVWQLQAYLEEAGARVDHMLPGDIVIQTRSGSKVGTRGILFEGSPGHVGIVDELTPNRTAVVLIEGNIRNEVTRMMRYLPSREILASYRWPLTDLKASA